MTKTPGRTRRGATLLTAGLLAIAAASCDGNNMFGPGVGLAPQLVHFTTPATVSSGTELQVQARAVALVRVDSIVITATGGEFALRRVQLPASDRTDFTTTANFDIPRPITDTLVIVTGIAFDAQGNRSLPRVDTVRAIDTTAPTATALVNSRRAPPNDTIVGQGKPLDIQVQAQDNIGLRTVGYRILRSDDLVVFNDSVLTSGRQAQHSFTYQVPVSLPLGSYRVVAFARDRDGNVGTAATPAGVQVIFIDEVRPTVQIQAPAAAQQVPEGDSLFVMARVRDNDGVAHVLMEGTALRGSADLGTEQVVARFQPRNIALTTTAPADTTLTRYLLPTGIQGAENVRIIVTATDRQGNVRADTVTVQLLADVNPPVVTIDAPGNGAAFQVGDTIPVRVTVSDPAGFVRSGVTHVEFRGISLRGDPALLNQTEVVRFQTREVVLNPPRVLPQAILREMIPTPVTDEEVAYFIVTARDARGNVGADTIQVLLTVDDVAPTITILEPASGTGVPLGDSLLMRARVQDAGGIVRVTFDGVAHRGDRDLGTHQEVSRFTPRTVTLAPPHADTTLARYIQPIPSLVSETIYLRVVAEDNEGNIARDSIAVTLGGPRVQLPDLVNNQPVPSGQDIQIRVTAQDPTGINLVEVEISGVATALLQDGVLAGQNPVSIDRSFTFSVPPAITGVMTLRARARNASGIFGAAQILTLNVVGGAVADQTAPEVRVTVQPQGSGGGNRVEATDPIRISVTARDNPGGSGVITTGYSVRAKRRGPSANPLLLDTLWISDSFSTGGGVGGTVTRIFDPTILTEFEVAPGVPFFDPINRPDTIDLDIYGWAIDNAAVPNCAAAVSPTVFQQLTCSPTGGPSNFILAQGDPGQRISITVVSGETVRLPAGGTIADASVDPASGLLFLSNIGRGWLEVFDLNLRTFEAVIPVGSDPWGISGSAVPGRLYVGNSGGTNISIVDIPTRQETSRVSTPNTLLWDVQTVLNQGILTFNTVPYDFSDRPQFLAEDATGRVLYSTRPTGSAPDGTIRLVDFGLGPDPEVLLLTQHGRTSPAEGWSAVWNVDRVFTGPGGVFMRTERPGSRVSAPMSLESALYFSPTGVQDALLDLRAQVQAVVPGAPAYYPNAVTGRWDVNSVGLTDTTFIAAAGDRSVIAIGEGATATTGRIMLWDAAATSITDAISVLDLVGNASERVLGVAMNQDGAMGVGRGILGLYFFDRTLRLVGSPGVGSGGAGVALHPLHTGQGLGTPAHTAYAFAPVGDGTIEIFNTRNYFRSGRIYIRDVVVGPMRAALPFPADNAGLTCVLVGGAVDIHNPATQSACVAVKLYGVTSGGGVTVINVTKQDILRGP